MSLRTAAFRTVFYGGSVPFVLGAPIAALFGMDIMRRYCLAWARFHRWALATIQGIKIVTRGERPTGPAFYAAKHQAMLETLELALLLDAPAIVMKAELARIPVWGWAARRYGVIVVDRDASAGALRRMIADAKAAMAAGRSVVIFPEGTRVKPGEAPPLRSGFAGLYRMLGQAVIPIALDSGRLWPRRGPKRRGTVHIAFQPQVPAGLPRGDAEARVHAGINALEPAAEARPESSSDARVERARPR